ncbi:ABC transporter permease [Hyphomicrobiales bacterium]|jgi:NitT/TauT family transport system permease protein|nr:ABC transporter permease [Hyphomicrobiales bacterium]|tara:strand:- start:135 stop:1010 length:876 start_codon:yes stop_codon:yes gene_type:complete
MEKGDAIMSDVSSDGILKGVKELSLVHKLSMHLGVFVILIGGWELGSRLGYVNELIMPPPTAIGYRLYEMFFITGSIYWHYFVTMFEAVCGFIIGVSIGLSLAITSAISPVFRRYWAPYAIVFNVTPGIAVTPFIIAWFGFGWSSKIALAALVCFFPPFINTLTGLLYIDKDATELFRSLGANRKQYFWKLQIPSALPIIIAGLKLAMTGALIGAIVAEFFSASEGVGILMQRFAFRLNMDGSFAALIVMSLMGLSLFTLMEYMDVKVLFWRRHSRMEEVSKKRKAKWSIN